MGVDVVGPAVEKHRFSLPPGHNVSQMRQSTHVILRGTASSLLLVGGLALVFVVAVRAYFAVAGDDLALLGIVDLVAVLSSAGLFVAARRVAPDTLDWQDVEPAGPIEYTAPEPSRLEELGYRVPSVPESTGVPVTTREDGTLYRLCEECGGKNGVDYTYCRQCSTELTD
jgi:hypothetical protein